MIIRPATVDDVPGVLPLVRKINLMHQDWDRERFGLNGDPAVSYDRWLRARCGDRESVFLVAVADGADVVGYLVGTVEDEIPIYWQPRCGWIHDLWVEEDYRHEGIGKQLTLLAMERFGDMGIQQVRLQTATANEVGRKLFASCGFRPCTVEMLANIDGSGGPPAEP